jgi:hypothetical protein
MFQDIVKGAVHQPPTDHLTESWHQWSQREIDALTLSMAAKRPLLVRGSRAPARPSWPGRRPNTWGGRWSP